MFPSRSPRRRLGVCLLSSTLALTAWAVDAPPAFEPANLDLQAKPSEDFNRFANGGWLDRNPIPADHTYTLNDMSDDALEVLRTRTNIACVLVNPLQALHPNANAPSDGSQESVRPAWCRIAACR